VADTILIVDDDEQVAQVMSDAVVHAGYTAAVARHGVEALAYLRSNPAPRMILLDLAMPVMDGYAFRRQQLQDHSLAFIPTIVMTAGYIDQRTPELEVAGWLRKPCGLESLIVALEQRRHPMQTKQSAAEHAAEHIVQLYDDVGVLMDGVCRFLSTGLASGEALMVIATAANWLRIRAKLGTPAELLDSGRLTYLDANETLSSFMINGSVDSDRFDAVIGGALQDAVRRSGASKVRAYGEMVNLLWQGGKIGTAVRVEQLWNNLMRRHPFSLYCSYLIEGDGLNNAESLAAIAEVHSAVRHRRSA
jgi:CheY-like chemotaxis protein